ncbi:DUF2029 domain-containing protein [bacterium]|nr:DUF2029 domain-containing protein [bacterium]
MFEPRRQSRVIILGYVLLAAIAAAAVVRIHGQYCLPIFSGAGADAWAGIEPYLVREGRPDFFKYAPLWSVLLIPLNLLGQILPQIVFQWAWCFLNFLCFFFGSFLYFRSLRDSGGSGPVSFVNRVHFLVLIALLLPLMVNNGLYGQINSLLWLLISVGIVGLRSARRAFSFLGGLCLSLAIWMKLFPVLFAVFLVFPGEKISSSVRRWSWAGLAVGVTLGVVLPVVMWGDATLSVFKAWSAVLSRDIHTPHLKIGLASLLPASLLGLLPLLQALYFGSVVFLCGLFDRRVKKGAALGTIDRSQLECLLMLGVLLLSHMTEPPTLALLAPVMIWVWMRGPKWATWVLLAPFLLLPSDLTPSWLKESLGGQYHIKTIGLLLLLTFLVAPSLYRTTKLTRSV